MKAGAGWQADPHATHTLAHRRLENPMAITHARASRMVRRASLDFSAVKDPRRARGKRHALSGLLNLLVVGLACGKLTLRAIESLSALVGAKMRRRLGLSRTVSDTTLYELLASLHCVGFRETNWQMLRRDLESKAITNDFFAGGVLVLDGKGAGGGLGKRPNITARQSVCDATGQECWDVFALRASLVSSSARPVLDQEFILRKEAETTVFGDVVARNVKSFPKLFRIVSVDAGMTSRENARKVIQLGKDYLFAIKGNAGRIHERAQALLVNQPVVARTEEHQQGKLVIRELRRCAIPADCDYEGARELFSVTQTRRRGTDVEREARYFLSSSAPDSLSDDRALLLVRLHWGIENGPNWSMDMMWEEDTRGPCMREQGVLAMSWPRILAYNITATGRAHLPKKDQLPASWSDAMDHVFASLLWFGGIGVEAPATALA